MPREVKQETLADIVTSLRHRAEELAKSLGDMHSYVENLQSLADRIEEAAKRERVCRRSIEIPVKIVPTCSAARAQRRLELLRAQMSNMADSVECGEKVRFNPRAVIAEIDDTLAAQPRNCDVFADALWDTISSAWQDWLLTPEFNKRKVGGIKEFCYWFLGPAKEVPAK